MSEQEKKRQRIHNCLYTKTKSKYTKQRNIFTELLKEKVLVGEIEQKN